MRVGTMVRVMKCKQYPKIVGCVGRIVAGIDLTHSSASTKCVVEFHDGYKRLIRKSWLEVVE